MANINFPAMTTSAYRGNISKFRSDLHDLAAYLGNSPKAIPEVLAQWNAFLLEVAATSATIANGQALTVPVTGSYTDTATVTVVDGAVTAIVLS
jgi:hypothetical protein